MRYLIIDGLWFDQLCAYLRSFSLGATNHSNQAALGLSPPAKQITITRSRLQGALV